VAGKPFPLKGRGKTEDPMNEDLRACDERGSGVPLNGKRGAENTGMPGREKLTMNGEEGKRPNISEEDKGHE